jgi:hypothetical protein
MMKNKAVSDFHVLAFIGYSTVKNKLKTYFRKPLNIIATLLTVLWVSSLLFGFALNRGDNEIPPEVYDFLLHAGSYIGGFIFLIFAIYVPLSLLKAARDYTPVMFSKSDESYLFTSPVSQRLIYFTAFCRSLWGNIKTIMYLTFFIMLLGGRLFSYINPSDLVIMIVGFSLYLLFIKSIRFFIYSLKLRFRTTKAAKTVIYALVAALISFTFYQIIKNMQSPWAMLRLFDSKSFELVPVIGWIKAITIVPFYKGTGDALLYLILFAVLGTLSLLLSLVWAEGYIEDAIAKGHTAAFFINRNSRDLDKSKSDDVKYEGTGPKAYLWKQMVSNKHNGRFITIGSLLSYLALIGLGTVFGFIFAASDASTFSILILLIILGFITTLIQAAATETITYELSLIYFFTTPGRPVLKMIYSNLFDFLTLTLKKFLFPAPLVVMGLITPLQFFALILYQMGTAAIVISNRVLYAVLFPDEENKGLINRLFWSVIALVCYLPGVTVSVITGIISRLITGSVSIASICIAWAVGSAVSVFFILLISERIFYRVEQRKIPLLEELLEE